MSDALLLSRMVDGVVFVASARQTRKRQAKRAVDMLNQVNAPILGYVLNGMTRETTYGYRYSGRYGSYGSYTSASSAD